MDISENNLTKKGLPRKRKPKKKNTYFTQETEDAILAYLKEENHLQRDKIFNEKIYHALYKLAENIIHTFKFYYTEVESLEDLKHEVMIFLLERFHLYHPSKNVNKKITKLFKEYEEPYEDYFLKSINYNTIVSQEEISDYVEQISHPNIQEEARKITPPKAFSYFGTIAKRYLITYNEKNYNNLKDKSVLDEVDENEEISKELIDKSNNHVDLSEFLDIFINYTSNNLNTIFKKEKDRKTADAILEIFRKREKLEIFNKKAIYLYLREIIDTDTTQITKIIKKLKIIYTRLFQEYYKNGELYTYL
jgi:hypothetical protein